MQKREEERRAALAPALDYDSVLSLEKLVESSRTCQRGVSWKGSVQSFCMRRASNCSRLKAELDAGTYRKEPATRFTLRERGCERSISGVSFRDRVVQRALCDGSLVPLLTHGAIDDNCASLKGKGTHLARKRFALHMAEAHRRWGNKAACVQYDFRKYFASIDSRRASEGIKSEYLRVSSGSNSADALKLWGIVDSIVTEESGMGLGNQTSQTVAIWFASPIDHYVREVLRCGLSGRYMDDGYVFCCTEDAPAVLATIKIKAEELGLQLHPRKSRITPITSPLSFLKASYTIHGSYVRMDMCSKSLLRTIRHMRHVHGLLEKGRISEDDFAQSLASTYGTVCRIASSKQRRRFEASISAEWHDLMRDVRTQTLGGACS